MPATQSPQGLMADLARRGFSLRVAADKIVVTPASRLTPDDRAAIANSRSALLAALSPCESWNAGTAHQLMADADALVERLGVSGHHPEVSHAAAAVTSAFATRHLEALRFAVAEFETVVRGVAARAATTRCESTEPSGGT